jgi:hypothetical protein
LNPKTRNREWSRKTKGKTFLNMLKGKTATENKRKICFPINQRTFLFRRVNGIFLLFTAFEANMEKWTFESGKVVRRFHI